MVFGIPINFVFQMQFINGSRNLLQPTIFKLQIFFYSQFSCFLDKKIEKNKKILNKFSVQSKSSYILKRYMLKFKMYDLFADRTCIISRSRKFAKADR